MKAVKKVVVIGASLGGIAALEVVLGAMPSSFDAAVAIVQHRAVDSSDRLLAILRRGASIELSEAFDKQPLVAGEFVIAPPGYHMMVDETCFSLSTEAHVQGARPSIDVLFESAARSFGRRAAAVVLTSASEDGAAGARMVEASGGFVVIQDPDEALSSCLPAAAIESCERPRVMELAGIAGHLVQERAL
jgi:two-component system chemotaxis response regulator CheB